MRMGFIRPPLQSLTDTDRSRVVMRSVGNAIRDLHLRRSCSNKEGTRTLEARYMNINLEGEFDFKIFLIKSTDVFPITNQIHVDVNWNIMCLSFPHIVQPIRHQSLAGWVGDVGWKHDTCLYTNSYSAEPHLSIGSTRTKRIPKFSH